MNVAVERVPIGQDARHVRPGDLIFCHREGFTSWCIRTGEWIKYRRPALVSHAAFCETPDGLIEALRKGVVRTPLESYRDVEYWIVRTRLRGNDQAQAVAFARSCVGQEYGLGTDAGIALRFLTPGRGLWFGMNGTKICSGLAAQTQVRGWANYPFEPAACDPQELLNYYTDQLSNEQLGHLHLERKLSR